MKFLGFALVSSVALGMLSGCVTAGPVPGVIYSDVQGPVAVTSNANSSLHGEACATSWFGLVATGDASITAAAKAGGISQISHIDHHTEGVVVYTKYCTEVFGTGGGRTTR